MTRIYLTRHGETEWNKLRRFQGHKDSELTDKGVMAAELLSDRIEDIDLDCIVASPLKRAYRTAEIVRGSKQIDIETHDGFKEINLGDFEGMSWDEIMEGHGAVIDKIKSDPFKYGYPNGESLFQFYERVQNAFKEVIGKCRGKKVLIVAHGGTIKCIESYIRKLKIHNDWMGTVVSNCSLSCFDVDDNDEIKEIFYNDVEHLESSAAFN